EEAAGDVASVQLELASDGEPFVALGGPLLSPPYTRSLDTGALGPGSYRLRAVARDGAGNEDDAAPETSFHILPGMPQDLVARVEGDKVALTGRPPSGPVDDDLVARGAETPETVSGTGPVLMAPLALHTLAVRPVVAGAQPSGPATVAVRIYRPTIGI